MADRPGVTLSPATTNQGHLPDDDVEHNASTTPALASCLQPQSPSWASAMAVIAIVLLILAYVLGHKKVLNSLCQRIRTLITRRTPGAGTNGNSDGQLREVLTTGSQGDHRVSEQSPLMGERQDDVTRASSDEQFSRSNPTHVLREGLYQRKPIIRRAFEECFINIINNLALYAALYCAMNLKSKEIISQAEYESIMVDTHPVRRAEKLCDIISKTGELSILAFVDILSTMGTAEKEIAKAIQDKAHNLGLVAWPGST